MHGFHILPDAWFAGYCNTGGSNKRIWAACLAIEAEDATEVPASVVEAGETELVYLCVHGAFGANLRVETPQMLPAAAAYKRYQKKYREKLGKGYHLAPFQPFLPAFGHPAGLPLVWPWPASPSSLEGEQRGEAVVQASTALPIPEAQAQSVFRYPAALVKPLTLERLQERYEDSQYGLTEKVNGVRCLVEVEGTQIHAYNRKGYVMLDPPAGAQALTRLDFHWVVDGERLTGKFAGTYVIFDLLEGDHEPLLDVPYQERMSLLIDCLHHDGLLKEKRCTPTLQQALANSTVPNLAILGPISGASAMQAVYKSVQAEGGEGVICRKLMGCYQEGAEKVKFLADLDAFVFGIEPGPAGGSLRLGVIRPGDQAVVEVGHVRSGLGMQDMQMIHRWVKEGGFPVFTIQYLAARTVGLHLVEPRTSLLLLRTDKDPCDCSTDQFGPEKASLVAQAIPLTGIIVPGMAEKTREHLDIPPDHVRPSAENLPGGKRGHVSPSAFPGEKGPGDGHRKTAAREDLSKEEMEQLVDYFMQEMEKEDAKRFDAYIAAHAEEAKTKFIQALQASSEERVKKAQSMRAVPVPETAEQAGDEQPGNAC